MHYRDFIRGGYQMENNRQAIYFIPIDCTTQRLAVVQANPFSNSV